MSHRGMQSKAHKETILISSLCKCSYTVQKRWAIYAPQDFVLWELQHFCAQSHLSAEAFLARILLPGPQPIVGEPGHPAPFRGGLPLLSASLFGLPGSRRWTLRTQTREEEFLLTASTFPHRLPNLDHHYGRISGKKQMRMPRTAHYRPGRFFTYDLAFSMSAATPNSESPRQTRRYVPVRPPPDSKSL